MKKLNLALYLTWSIFASELAFAAIESEKIVPVNVTEGVNALSGGIGKSIQVPMILVFDHKGQLLFHHVEQMDAEDRDNFKNVLNSKIGTKGTIVPEISNLLKRYDLELNTVKSARQVLIVEAGATVGVCFACGLYDEIKSIVLEQPENVRFIRLVLEKNVPAKAVAK